MQLRKESQNKTHAFVGIRHQLHAILAGVHEFEVLVTGSLSSSAKKHFSKREDEVT